MITQNKELRPQVILTGVSGSGKTTLMKSLLSHQQFAKPIQFTTRKPRMEIELDDYVFLGYELFLKKLINGDFVEYTEYNKELYSISKYFDTSLSNVFIAEPVGREALKKYFKLNGIPFLSFYITLPEEEMERRLEERRSSTIEIENRKKDYKYFYPQKDDIILDGTDRPHALEMKVVKKCDSLKI